MKIVFMGTPDIAAAALEAVLQAGHDVCGVYTREDKPVGRKQVLTAPPVKQVALTHGLPVFQPKTLRDGAALAQLQTLAPELIVVVAYGRILPPEILTLPRHGCINLHVSLLPQYRGAAPVQRAVIDGQSETGVTIMQLDEGVDTGDILRMQRVQIEPDETSGELFERITQVGAQNLLACIDEIDRGTITRTPQDHALATLAPPLTKEQAEFDFAKSAEVLHNLVRGMNPWPVAYFWHDEKKIKVLRSKLCAELRGKPGEILSLKPFTVACAEGALSLLQVVPEGSKPMDGSAWAAGRRFSVNDIVG